ncbi:uncharacterized protein LOC133791453 [Humulus lupulus]|uniref:uncharacterized protein LOC133791453 n=1 Tax=Humulus lupulus TaxID=3486 RepID=UPI002B411EB3|nr:uncharacterized protein LOC133791453 [Humulus lupulus]
MEQLVRKGRDGILLQLFSINASQPKQLESIIPREVQPLLQKYHEVIVVPKGLPPTCSHDHRIPLIPGKGPVSVRPYKYPHFQKSEIERLVNELLASGVIRVSNSPYSSPVLLVKKHDGSWRMCIDHRELNKITIKDKFPIPFIDELLDDLHGAKPEKCAFGQTEVKYLGHVIFHEGVAVDPEKISAMVDWPKPKNVKALRGFLGVTGKDNVVADALSRREEGMQGEVLALFLPIPNWTTTLKEEIESNSTLQQILKNISKGEAMGPWKLHNGLIFFKDRSYLAKDSSVIEEIINQFHGSTHEGVQKTLHRIQSTFYWQGMRKHIKEHIRSCEVC